MVHCLSALFDRINTGDKPPGDGLETLEASAQILHVKVEDLCFVRALHLDTMLCVAFKGMMSANLCKHDCKNATLRSQ